MFNRYKYSSIIMIAIITSCATVNNNTAMKTNTMSCIDQKIADFSNNARCKDAQVKEYLFQQKTVFVFEHGTCVADMTSQVLDANCVVLGSLGGIMGNTKIKGEEFSTAKFVKNRWEK